ncbi:MAG: hypothetical protein R3C56_31290 [Pirellulaceae bacterium]
MDQLASTTILSTLQPQPLSRRQFVHGLSLGLAATVATGVADAQTTKPSGSAATAASSNKKVLLVQPHQVSELNTRAKIVLEVTGQLRVTEGESNSGDKESDSSPAIEVKGKSTLDYFEKIALYGGCSGHRVRPHGGSPALY